MTAPKEPNERAAYALANMAATRPEFLDDLCRVLGDEVLGYWAAQGIASLDTPPKSFIESIAEWGMSTDIVQHRAALRAYLVLPGQARAWVIGRGLDDMSTRTLALRVMLALSTKSADIAALLRRSSSHSDPLVRNVIAVEMGVLDPTTSIPAAIAFTSLPAEPLPADAYRGVARVVHPSRQLAATWDGEVIAFRLPTREIVLRQPCAPPATMAFVGNDLAVDGYQLRI